MGSVHQLAELSDIVGLQRGNRLDGALVLINRVLCALSAYLILDRILILLKLLLVQVAQGLDVHHLLQLGKSGLALASSLVVFGIAQAALLVAAGDDDLRAFQMDGRVLIAEIRGIQEDGMILLSHGDGELIHDAAVNAVEIILGILADQRQILIGHVKAEHVAQDEAGQHLQGSGGGKAGAVGNIAAQHQIHAVRDLHVSLLKSPHHSLGIIGPVRLLFRRQVVQAALDHAEMLEIHGEEAELSVLSLSRGAVGSDGQRAGEYMSAVIVRMFSDQIHTAGRKIGLHSFGISEYFPEFLQDFFFHFHNPFSFSLSFPGFKPDRAAG